MAYNDGGHGAPDVMLESATLLEDNDTLRKDNDALKKQMKHMNRVQKKRDLENTRELNAERAKFEESTKLLEHGKIRQWELQKQNRLLDTKNVKLEARTTSLEDELVLRNTKYQELANRAVAQAKRANETVRDLQAALRFSETTIARHEADKRTMTLRIEYLSSSNARMERVFTESEDLSDSLKTQKMHNLALKEEIGRLKYEIDTLANAQQFYIEKSVQPCKCLLHQLQQVKLGETD